MPQVVRLSAEQLASHAESWDSLWRRSDSRLPNNLAAGVRLWCNSFSSASEFVAVAVVDGDEFLAAIPFVKSRKGPLRFYSLPANHTVAAGDLLVDPARAEEAIDGIIEGLRSFPGGLFAFEGIEIESNRWQALISALADQHVVMHQSRGHDVGVVDVLHDWDAYQKSWSRNHRSAIKRTRNKLNAEGDVTIERIRKPSDDELHSLLEKCFAIEDRSWKGSEGTSILKSDGLRDYYHQEAKLMRDAGMLDLWLLQLDGEPIAFEYCHFSKGVCLSHKISFDPQWEKYSPGRLLRYFQLQQYHEDPACVELDTLGVLCEAKAKWITRRYRSSRLYLGMGIGASAAINGWKTLRTIRDQWRPVEKSEPIKCGAERYMETAKNATQQPSAQSLAAPIATIDNGAFSGISSVVPTVSDH